jgi:putative endonuclease
VIHVDFFYSKAAAMTREKYFKSGIGREFIQNLIVNY